MNLQQLKDIVKNNNGATLTSNLDNATLESGYMVSLQGHELKTSIELLSSEMLEDYKQLAELNHAYIGFWMDKQDLYVDISINIQDKKQAIQMAQDNKQLAIYQIETGNSIYV